jgi:GTPase SAR1 family protein
MYTNAKVVLVGESQAGKSGLAMRLAHNRWEHTDSTIGVWATQLKVALSAAATDHGDREVWLWDFGGQADQRLIHQLYLGDTALAVLVFDGQRDDVIARLWDWNRALESGRSEAPKLLVAGRTDINPVRLRTVQLEQFRQAAGFSDYLVTSASTGLGCEQLRAAIIAAIDWNRVPWRSSPLIFQRLKREILKLKDAGRALTTTKELRDWLPTQIGPFDPDELDAVIGLLAGPGAVLPLEFGDHLLLQPEFINAYAQAVIKTLRDDPEERGCIPEEHVLRGELNYPKDFKRLPEGEERIVLHAMHKQLIERPICLRDHDPKAQRPTLLVFPSYFRRERPDRPGQPQSFMTYRFNGYLDEIYAALVVRLHHSEPFDSTQLWRNAADLTTQTGHQIGLRLDTRDDGSGDLELHCAPATPISEQVLFARYVHEHLQSYARDIVRLRTYICPHCATPVENRASARRRLLDGKPDILCVECEQRVVLWDEMERQLADPGLLAEVHAVRDAAQVVLDSESRERLLVGEFTAIVAAADQIAREVTVSDHGIDMEVEFRTEDGHATARKVYIQLKSGDSHLRPRKRDNQRIFRISNPRHAQYWADQAFPVMLVIRSGSGAIEWMEIREHLRTQRRIGEWPAREIVFSGQRLDVMAVRAWRAQVLREPSRPACPE